MCFSFLTNRSLPHVRLEWGFPFPISIIQTTLMLYFTTPNQHKKAQSLAFHKLGYIQTNKNTSTSIIHCGQLILMPKLVSANKSFLILDISWRGGGAIFIFSYLFVCCKRAVLLYVDLQMNGGRMRGKWSIIEMLPYRKNIFLSEYLELL